MVNALILGFAIVVPGFVTYCLLTLGEAKRTILILRQERGDLKNELYKLEREMSVKRAQIENLRAEVRRLDVCDVAL